MSTLSFVTYITPGFCPLHMDVARTDVYVETLIFRLDLQCFVVDVRDNSRCQHDHPRRFGASNLAIKNAITINSFLAAPSARIAESRFDSPLQARRGLT
jgi:hypothetical protein